MQTPDLPPRLVLQRRLANDGSRWRTVLRCSQARLEECGQLVRIADSLDPTTRWRLVLDDRTQREVARYVGSRWHTL